MTNTLGLVISKAKGYRYQVTFDKVFTKDSLLHGLRSDNEFIRFATWQDASDFVQSCDGKTIVNACAGSNYTKERPILEAIS